MDSLCSLATLMSISCTSFSSCLVPLLPSRTWHSSRTLASADIALETI